LRAGTNARRSEAKRDGAPRRPKSPITNLIAHSVDLAHEFIPRHRWANWLRVGGSKDFVNETSILLAKLPMLDTTLA
jgi:hypothetical protein